MLSPPSDLRHSLLHAYIKTAQSRRQPPKEKPQMDIHATIQALLEKSVSARSPTEAVEYAQAAKLAAEAWRTVNPL